MLYGRVGNINGPLRIMITERYKSLFRSYTLTLETSVFNASKVVKTLGKYVWDMHELVALPNQ